VSPDGTAEEETELSRAELIRFQWPSSEDEDDGSGEVSPRRRLASAIEVADWRRHVHALYAEVRRLSNVDLLAAHASWIRGRNALFARHPSTPLLPADRAHFRSLAIAPYDASWRFEVEVAPAEEPRRMDVETGTDGTVPFELVGTVAIPRAGTLDVWRLGSYGGGLFLPVKDALAGTPGGTYGRQGRRPRPRERPVDPGARLQLRLQPVLRVRPGVGVPPRTGRQHARRRGAGGRALQGLSRARTAGSDATKDRSPLGWWGASAKSALPRVVERPLSPEDSDRRGLRPDHLAHRA
jgi:hypothetical protein